MYLCKFVCDSFLLLIEVQSIVDCIMIFKGHGLKMGVFVGGKGVDLDFDFGMVSITFFLPPSPLPPSPPPPPPLGSRYRFYTSASLLVTQNMRPGKIKNLSIEGFRDYRFLGECIRPLKSIMIWSRNVI